MWDWEKRRNVTGFMMIILVCLRLYLAPKILDEEATDVSDVAAIEREEWFREKVSKQR